MRNAEFKAQKKVGVDFGVRRRRLDARVGIYLNPTYPSYSRRSYLRGARIDLPSSPGFFRFTLSDGE